MSLLQPLPQQGRDRQRMYCFKIGGLRDCACYQQFACQDWIAWNSPSYNSTWAIFQPMMLNVFGVYGRDTLSRTSSESTRRSTDGRSDKTSC